MITNTELAKCLLDEFIESCFFIHDDILDELRTDTGELNWDQFGTNSFFLGARACAVDTLDGFGEPYLDYLHSLNCLPETIIIPVHQTHSLVENLLMDQTALEQLRAVCRREHLNISSFYSDEGKDFEKLIAYLSEDDYLPLLYPSKTAFQCGNDKLFMRTLMVNAGLAVPSGAICSSLEELHRICKHHREQGSLTLLKKMHWQTQAVAHEEMLKRCAKLEFPLIAEKAYHYVCSPVAHYIALKNQAAYLFSMNQIIENWHHYGNELPHKLSQKVLAQMAECSSAIIRLLPDYEGIIGIDYIVTPEDNVLAVDVNPRFNSSTYPLCFLLRMGIDLASVYVRYRFARVPVENVSKVFTDRDFIAFNPRKSEGILMLSPVFNFAGGFVTRFLYLIVAKNPTDLARFENTLLNLVEKYRI